MNDKQCLMQLINSLGLKKIETGLPDVNEWIKSNETIILGRGNGYSGFNFDVDDKCIGHDVWKILVRKSGILRLE